MNIKETREAVLQCFMTTPPLVPLVQSYPGLGKSDMVKSIAKELNLELIDVRLAQMEPNDLLGYPTIEGGRSKYIPMDIFPLEGDELPKGKDGFILFLDELRNANIHVQQAAYRILLDREVGNSKLHDHCLVVAAGNREEDGCFVPPMPSALRNRVVHLNMEVDKDEWLNWAVANNVDPRITTYIQFKPQSLMTDYADSAEASFGSPRSWEFVNRIISGKDKIQDKVTRSLVNGAISTPVAADFYSYIQYFDSVASYKDVLKDPKEAKCPEYHDIGLIWATIGMLSGNFKEKDIEPVMTYLERLPEEYQLVFMKDIAGRYPKILQHPVMRTWIPKIANVMWGG